MQIAIHRPVSRLFFCSLTTFDEKTTELHLHAEKLTEIILHLNLGHFLDLLFVCFVLFYFIFPLWWDNYRTTSEKNLLKLYCIWIWDTFWVFCLFVLFCVVLFYFIFPLGWDNYRTTSEAPSPEVEAEGWTPKLLRLKLHCIWTWRFLNFFIYLFYFILFLYIYFFISLTCYFYSYLYCFYFLFSILSLSL
jgi:hypothetical protein